MRNGPCYTLEEVLEREAQDEKWIRKIGKFTLPSTTTDKTMPDKQHTMVIDGNPVQPVDVDEIRFMAHHIIVAFGYRGIYSTGMSEDDSRMLNAARRTEVYFGEYSDG